MSTLDELERSVERLNRAVERLSGGMGKYGFANVYNDDVQLLLSERAELLATVERMREVINTLLEALRLARDHFVNSKSACAEICDAAILKATTPNAGERG